MPRYQANLLLLAAGALWGMGFVAQSTAMSAIGPLLFVGLRFLFAAVAVAPLAWFERARRRKRGEPPLTVDARWGFIAIGLSLFGGMSLQQVGLLTTSVTNSGFLTGLYVVFVPFIALLVFRTKPHVLIWPAVALTFSGIFLLSGGRAAALTPGDYLTIACAGVWAVQVILIARYAASSGRPFALSLVQFSVTAICGLAFALVFEPLSVGAIRDALPEILFAGLFSGAMAFTLQVIGQRWTTAPQAAIFLSTEALFAALFGALFLGETIAAIGYLGCVLIFAAILIAELGPALLPQKQKIA